MPDDHTPLLDKLSANALRLAPPEASEWRSHEIVRDETEATIRVNLSWCQPCEWTERFHAAISIGDPDDYRQRLIPIDGGHALAGIRFRGGDRAHPFVDLVAWTIPDEKLADAAFAALEAFALFKPRVARIYGATNANALVALERSAMHTADDQFLIAARLGELARAPSAPFAHAVSLDPIPPESIDEAASFVAENYELQYQRAPQLRGLTHPGTSDELRSCQESGRLAYWTVDGRRAGLIACERTSAYLLDGHLAIEIVADPRATVPGAATAAQAALVRDLASAEPGLVYFGTIAAENTASRRAAARVGRAEIARWLWLAPDGPPWR